MSLKGYLFHIIVLITVVSNNLFATNENAASLINANNTEDSLYYYVFLKYRVENIDSATKYAKLSYNQSIALNDIELTIKSLNALGYCYRNKSIYDSALYVYKLGVQQSKVANNEIRQIFFYNNIGIVYNHIGVYDSAIANYFSSLQLAQRLDRYKDVSIALMNIGNINLALENNEVAIKYYSQSLEIKEEYGYSGVDFAYYNLGLCYNKLKDYDNAIEHFNKLISFCANNECELDSDLAILGLGLAYFGLNNYDLATEYFKQIKGTEDIRSKIAIYRTLSQILSEKEDYKRALELIDSSIVYANQIKRPEELETNYETKGEILSKVGMLDSALFYYQKHYALKDSLFNEAVALSIQDLFVGFEREQAEATIRVKEREITVRKRANILFALVIILSLAIIIKAIMDLTKRKKMNKYLDKQVALKTSELTELNKNLQDKSKDLNNLIYNISHEIRGPLARLLGLINLGQMESHKDLKDVKYYGKLQNEVIELESILKRMTITNYVNHHEVNIVGIKPDEFFENLIANSRYLWQDKIKIDLELDGIQELNTDTQMLEIALQNIIANAVKFRNPRIPDHSILNIKLEKGEKDRIDILLLDNGIGFDEQYKDLITDLFFVASELGGVGMGLHQTKLALTKINAEFEVLSTRNPTSFVVHL
jgi:signal transduction histidine kinase